jgi:hypothetical protein
MQLRCVPERARLALSAANFIQGAASVGLLGGASELAMSLRACVKQASAGPTGRCRCGWQCWQLRKFVLASAPDVYVAFLWCVDDPGTPQRWCL